MYTVSVTDQKEKKYSCPAEEDLLTAARRQGVMIPAGCRGGGCGMCKIQIQSGNFERGACSLAILPEEQRKAGYTLACKTIPKSDLEIKIHID